MSAQVTENDDDVRFCREGQGCERDCPIFSPGMKCPSMCDYFERVA